LNAIFNLPFPAKVIIGFVVILLTWFVTSGGDNTEDEAKAMASNVNQQSDYGMTNFTMTIMDENGQPSRVIAGKEMTHFPKGDRTEIIDPTAHFIENQQDTWVITSKHGKTRGEGKLIKLTKDVVITRINNDEIELRTDKLNIDTQQSTAYTDSAVTIISPTGETKSVGLHATLEEKTINLHSKVKGHYDAPPIQ
jgi:lipopolysaccharide export system protein LptC